MPLPVALTIAYLAVNLPLMYWLEWERARGRSTPGRVTALAGALRYGPALFGAGYLVVISGDWPFVLFVVIFFTTGAWLMTGLLAYPSTLDRSEAARSSRAPSARDRDRARR